MASPSNVSEELRSFLRERIASYEQLEALLLLRRQPDQSFSLQAVAKALRVTEDMAAEALGELRRRDLLQVAGDEGSLGFKYGPAIPALNHLVDQLAEAWTRDPLGVMNLMSSNAIERVRTEAIHTFGDAFVLRKKKDED